MKLLAPSFEQFEPRLLMSGSPALEQLLSAAAVLDITPGQTTSTLSSVAWASDSKLYQFTTNSRGKVYVELAAVDGGIDPYLELFDANGRRLAGNNDARPGTLDSRIVRYVCPGQTYYVLASGNDGTTGQFELSVTSDPVDDFGNSPEVARLLRLRRDGASSVRGMIHYGGDEDCFSFVAVKTGLATVGIRSYGYNNNLVATLTAYGQQEGLLASGQLGAGQPASLSFHVEEGQTYYLKAAGVDGTTGRYYLQMAPTLAQEFVEAQEVDVPGEAVYSVADSLVAGGSRTYMITASADGYVYVDMAAAQGSGVDCYLEVFNSAQRLVARNDNLSRDTADSRVRIRVREGQTYYVRASAAAGTEGAFALTFTGAPVDDYANQAAAAWAMRVRKDGSAAARGTINYAGDIDQIAYTAVETGLAQVQMLRYGRSNDLLCTLTAYDASGLVVGVATAGEDDRLELSFSVVAGQTYYLAAEGAGDTQGRYMLYVLPTLWQVFLDAEEVDVPTIGSETVGGSVVAGGAVGYKFTADADGYVDLDMTAAGGGGLDSYLEVFDTRQRRLAANDDAAPGDVDSHVRLRVRAGQTYYVRCSGYGLSEGDFELTLTSSPYDDAGNDAGSAFRLPLTAAGAGSIARTINYVGDVDVLKVVAPVTGEMKVALAASGSAVAGRMWAADAAGDEIIADDAADGTVEVVFEVVAGRTYYLGASALNGTTGRYTLTVCTTPEVVPVPAPDPDPAPAPPPPPPPPAPTPGVIVTGQVVQDGGTTRLVIVGTNGNDVITLSYAGMATTVVTSSGTLNFLGQFSAITIYGFAGNDVIRTTYSITGSCLIYAGDGNDRVYDNGPGASTVYGGAGDDVLITVGGGADTIFGEGGSDSFWADSTDAIRDASAAERAALAVHQIASFYQPWTSNPASGDFVSLDSAGQNLRDPVPNSYARGWANFAHKPLFADGPEYNDIRQGACGDCYYLATLASLADTDPDVIRQMVTDLGDGTYAVRFFRDGREVYVRVDADLPIYSGSSLTYAALSPDGEIWVAIAEKAYCHFRYGQNSYGSIEGGWMSTVYREVTNQSTTTTWTGGTLSSLALLISNALAGGHAATLGSYAGAPSPIVGSHAYMIKSIEGSGSSAYVTVYNPWGQDGRSYDSNPYDGLLRLSITQIQQCFSAVVVSLA